MTPEIRAIADRFILDTANVKYLATVLPKGALARPTPAGDWTVRQVIGHIVAGLERHVEFSRLFLADGTFPDSFDPQEFNALSAAATRKTTLPVLLARLDAATGDMLSLLGTMPEDSASSQFGPVRLGDAFGIWSRHIAHHGMDLVDAVEELRVDPMVLNWILHADFAADPERLPRQQHLLAEVRDHLAKDAEEDWDGEEDWEEGDDEAL